MKKRSIFNRIIAFAIILSMIFTGYVSDNSVSQAADTPTVDIVGFAQEDTDNLRSSELLMAKVSGYSGDITKLTYKWSNLGPTSGSGSSLPLYMYASHNMMDSVCGKYGLLDGGGFDTDSNNSGIKSGQSRKAVGAMYAAIDGRSSGSSSITEANMTPTDIRVEVYTPEGELLCSTEETVGKCPDLQRDVDNCVFAMFEDDNKQSIKDFLAQAGIVHIQCSGCNVSGAVVQADGHFEVVDGGSSISPISAGYGTVSINVAKGQCRFHRGYNADAVLRVYVFKRPAVETTSTTAIITNLDPNCDYYIGGKKAIKDGDKAIVTGLDPSTDYVVETVASFVDTEDNNIEKRAYAYSSTKTKDPEVEITTKLDGTQKAINQILGEGTELYIKDSVGNYTKLTEDSAGKYSVEGKKDEKYTVWFKKPSDTGYTQIKGVDFDFSKSTDPQAIDYATLAFDPDGGKLNGTSDVQKTIFCVNSKENLKACDAPTKEENNFKGWKNTASGDIVQANATLGSLSAGATFKAMWEPSTYKTTVTIKMDGVPILISDLLPGAKAYASKDGNEYIELVPDSNNVYSADLPNGEYKVYAKIGPIYQEYPGETIKVEGLPNDYVRNFYTLTFDANSGAFADGKDKKTSQYAENDKYKIPADITPSKEGYTFEGWKDADGKSYKAGDEVTVSKTMNLVAQWKIIPSFDDKTPKGNNDLHGTIDDKDLQSKIPLTDDEKEQKVEVNLIVKQKQPADLPGDVMDKMKEEYKKLFPQTGNNTEPDGSKTSIKYNGNKSVSTNVKETDEEIVTTITTTQIDPCVYFDVNLTKTINDGNPQYINKTNSELFMSVDVPENFKNVPEGVERTYTVVQIVDGKEVVVPATYDPTTGKVTFGTSQFAQTDDSPSNCVLLAHDKKVEVIRERKLRSADIDNKKPAVGDVLTCTVTDTEGKKVTEGLSYQWQYSTDGKTWIDISGATAKTLSVDEHLIGKYLRCVATGNGKAVTGVAYSTATAKVSNEANIPTIVMNKQLGLKKKFQIKLINTKGAKISVYSKNKKIASVNKKGIVTGKKLGKTKIVLSIKKGKKQVQYVTSVRVVKNVSKNYSLTKYKTSYKGPSVALYKLLYVKGKYTVKLKHVNKKAKIKYSSSNKKVATVTKKGVVKGIKKGTANVTISIKQNGIEYKYFVVCRVCKKGHEKNDTNYLKIVK